MQRRRVSSSMPTPVSSTETWTRGEEAAAPAAVVRTVNVPPCGTGVNGVENRDSRGLRVSHSSMTPTVATLRQTGMQLDHDTLPLRHVAPADARKVEYLSDQVVYVHHFKQHPPIGLAVKLSHASDRMGHVLDGALRGFQMLCVRVLRPGSLSSSDSV